MSVPQRPGIIIRAPEREKISQLKVNPSDSSPPPPPVSLKKTETSPYAFILYTNLQKCQHSADILQQIESKGLIFEARDVSKLSNIPSWLKGTPVIEYDGEGYCGDLAFNFIECLSSHMETAPSSTPVEQAKSRVKSNDNDTGCSFSKAFTAPKDSGEDNDKYNASPEEMKRNMELAMRR